MPTRQRAVLAVDLGTSAVKVLLASESGTILATASDTYPTNHPHPGHDEQSPTDWLEAIARTVSACRAELNIVDLTAVAITGQMHGTVCFDLSLTVLGNAIIWSDRRAADLVEGLPHALTSRITVATGGPVSTGTMATTLAWVRAHEPECWGAIHRVALPVDALGFLLTGEFAIDPSNAVGSGLYAISTGTWDQATLDDLGIPSTWLSPVVPTGTTIGELGPEVAATLGLPAGTPVIHAGGDAAAAAIGGDALTVRDAMITLSTGAQVVMPTEVGTPSPEGRWHTWPSALPALAHGCAWLRIGALLNAGRAIEWIHHTIAPDQPLTDLLDSAAGIDPGANGLLFVPSLAGERQPRLDPRARGAFLGLTEHHTPAHVMRAVLEGIALSVADMVSEMGDDVSPRRVTIGGGPARSPLVRQIIADCLGTALISPGDEPSSAYGAVRIATHVLGWTPIMRADALEGTVAEPDPGAFAQYQALLPIYHDACAAIAPISHRLSES